MMCVCRVYTHLVCIVFMHSTVHTYTTAGVGAAKSAALTFIVGGSTDAYESAKPLLEKMGKNVIHCGSTGSGQVCC